MDVVGVIPARYQSKRLPFKLLRKLKGKPLIQWTWENASKARILDKLIIACDDTKIEEQALGFGAEVVLTSTQHSCGTDRIAEAVKEIETKIIINIQADEPLICASTIDSLAQEMLNNPTLDMATVRVRISDEEDLNNPNTVKVVCDKDGFALYFSRSTIPCYRQKDNASLTYKHLGIYAYTKSFLYTFGNLPFSYLEKAEKLEQLRVLEAGYKIKVIETEFDSPGVDTEEDFQKVERILEEKSFAQ